MNEIFTIGHSTNTVINFISLLQANNISLLLDVRTIPRSRHNPQFNKDTLPISLSQVKIEYSHMPLLGGLRHTSPNSPNMGWRNTSFRGFADYMQTADFLNGLNELIELSDLHTLAIMCAEAVPWRCHRSLIADALIIRNIPVIEIISAKSHQLHTLTPFAHVEGTTITYPGTPKLEFLD